MKNQVLIAEDDADIAELISLYLENDDFEIWQARDGMEALQIFHQQTIDLMIVDIMMPRMNGYETIKKVREFSQIPILVLSAKSLNQDKILGLGLGADMYMTKPFDPLELSANVKALMRRSYTFGVMPEKVGKSLRFGDLTYDPESMCVYKNNQEVPLTAFELKILVKMMSSPGRVFTKTQLYQVINRDVLESDEDTIMVHISRIRSKIEDNPSVPKYIKTVRGLGYRFAYEAD